MGRAGEALLVLTTVIWGTTFILTKQLTTQIPPMLYLGLRFAVGGLALVPVVVLGPRGREGSWSWTAQARLGAWAGVTYFVSATTQTIGLQFTTASKAAFLTALSVVFVPFLLAIGWKERVPRGAWVGALVATGGIYLLSFAGLELPSPGDPLVLVCAVAFALYTIYIGRWSDRLELAPFTFVQLVTSSLLCLSTSWALGEAAGTSLAGVERTGWLVLIYLGVVATAGAVFTQAAGQRSVPPARAALIFALEPVFATYFGIVWGGEALTLQAVAGAALILAGIVLAIEKKGGGGEEGGGDGVGGEPAGASN
ncbi:MAG: DMT family transporter [Promethearchaeota archaeon]